MSMRYFHYWRKRGKCFKHFEQTKLNNMLRDTEEVKERPAQVPEET